MPEAFRSTKPNEALLNSLFGTPEEIKEEALNRWEQSQRERDEIAADLTIEINDGSTVIVIHDEWEERSVG